MSLALIKSAKSVGAEGLHDADVHEGVVIVHEGGAIFRLQAGGLRAAGEIGEAVEIQVEQLLAQLGREIGFGIVEKRGDVILQSAFAAALVVKEKRVAIAQHDVAGLKVAIEKVVATGAQEKFGEAAEVVFERLLVKRNAGEAKKVILEIIQVPGDGLTIETGTRIADFVIQIASGFHLKAREQSDDLAIGF